MTVLDEIKEHFAAGVPGMRVLKSLPAECIAYTIRDDSLFGVAIKFPYKKEVSEKSNESKIYTREIIINGKSSKFLFLVCANEQYRLSFAQWCEHFVEPGENGENRNFVLKDTLTWWNKWVKLLGNKNTEKKCYSYIAELLALHCVYRRDKTAQWTASHAGRHDIETDTRSIEVKASVIKTSTIITVHGQFQLSSDKDLDLYFCRFEESVHGICINDAVRLLKDDGYDEGLLEQQLADFGLEKGASIRTKKYEVLELRKYKVDDSFPKITKDSFKDGKFPTNITRIDYEVDLDGLSYSEWELKLSGILHCGSNNPSCPKTLSYNLVDDEQKYTTHLPLYNIKAACGRFLEAEEAQIEKWIDAEAVGVHKHGEEFFIVQASGESMIPKIQDGDYCLFRVGGSIHRGDIVIAGIHDLDEDYNGRFTIKEFWQEFSENEDGSRERTYVTLKPLNQNGEYPTFELDAVKGDGFGVFGVFVEIVKL